MKNFSSICLRGMLLLAASVMINSAKAQDNTVRPFMGEQDVTEALFNMDEHDINYHFTADMGGGNMAIIEFKRLTDWPANGNLQGMLELAAKYYIKVEDSFRGATTPKRLDIHVPIEHEPATVRIKEYPMLNNVVLLKGDMQSPMKLGMDTIRILYATGERGKKHDHSAVQIQYTFLLKDIDQVKQASTNKAMIKDVSQTFESVVADKMHDWSRPDKWTHNLKATYYPTIANPKKRLQVQTVKTDNDKGKFYRAFDFDYGLGVTLFRSQLCPLTDIGISYKWPTRRNEYMYLRYGNSNFVDIIWNGTKYNVYGLVFNNVEFGWMKSKRYTNIPTYRTAIGFGWCNNNLGPDLSDPTVDKFLGKIYLSFSLSKVFTLTYDQYIITSTERSGFSGLTVTARIW